jgi:hypothetical protein
LVPQLRASEFDRDEVMLDLNVRICSCPWQNSGDCDDPRLLKLTFVLMTRAAGRFADQLRHLTESRSERSIASRITTAFVIPSAISHDLWIALELVGRKVSKRLSGCRAIL